MRKHDRERKCELFEEDRKRELDLLSSNVPKLAIRGTNLKRTL